MSDVPWLLYYRFSWLSGYCQMTISLSSEEPFPLPLPTSLHQTGDGIRFRVDQRIETLALSFKSAIELSSSDSEGPIECRKYEYVSEVSSYGSLLSLLQPLIPKRLEGNLPLQHTIQRYLLAPS